MQSSDTILMIEPVAFGFNAETAVNNYFQVHQVSCDTQSGALQEFMNFVNMLRSYDINVITIKDTLTPHTPDSIFPNNWISFHHDGTLILYPMFAVNRRLERRSDILEQLSQKGFKISTVKDYTQFEAENRFLEGTGSMILDRDNKIAYGAISLRLDEDVFKKWCTEFGYQPIIFHAFQSVNGQRLPIYHTNVMMCIASKFAVIGLETIDDKDERALIVESLSKCHKEIIEITEEQVHSFAGNMLEVRNRQGKPFLVMSKCAYQSLSSTQIQRIRKYTDILYADLHTIERNGGGSARCMMAEVFLPKA